jgi:hypothetical protein
MDEGVREAACAIRWYLPELVGPAAAELDSQLTGLLAAAAGEDVGVQMRALLDGREATHVFLEAVLEDAPNYRPPQVRSGAHRGPGYSALPGSHGPVDVDKFCCPEGDYVWYQQAVGVPVPSCPTHGPLVLC